MKFPGRINQIVISVTVAGSTIAVLLASKLFKYATNEYDDPQLSWLIRFVNNIFGYLIIITPLYLVLRFVQRSQYCDVPGVGFLPRLIRRCFAEPPPNIELLESAGEANKNQSDSGTALKLIFCILGLMTSYLTWGFLQEKVMTKEYKNAGGDVGKFKDSQFLVFVNRILAFCLAGLYLAYKRENKSRPIPMYKYLLCSLSNILSSFCQYEALKYVTFPLQVLAKSCKVIPVMIMGKCVSSKKYENYEYITAVMISLGMASFLFGQENSSSEGSTVVETTIPGIILLASYLACDSFTSNWQGKLFTQYKVSSVQMMMGVNLFSCLLTTTSLLEQGAFPAAIAFMSKFPAFVTDCVVLSICSAVGQLFIFYTIAQFGAVTFTIIMTIRQGLAILLSCIIYGHNVSASGVFGIMFVFLAVFLRMYCAQRLKTIRQRKMQQTSGASTV